MKKLIVFLLVIGALYYMATTAQWKNLGLMGRDPSAIANPVYAVMRFRTEFQDRSVDMVALVKTFDQEDCRTGSDKSVDRVLRPEHPDGGLVWQLVSSECKSVLDSRSAKLFDNIPTYVNYVSAAPGAASEREIRLIFWGVTADEGDMMCGQIPRMQARWKGAVTCIRGHTSE
jgi:hypothetical protein